MQFPFSFWKARTLQGIDIELSMRAIQERRVVAGHAVWPWPNVIFDSNGNELNGGIGNPVGDYPPDDTYDADVTYSDTFYGDPAGTKAAFLVNDLIDACISTVGFGDYIDPSLIEGQASLTVYTASIFPAAGSATTVNYLSKLEDCKTGIRLLTDIFRQASQVDKEEKAGYGPTLICNLAANSMPLKIKDFDENAFIVTNPNTTCTDSGPWDGTGYNGPQGAVPCQWTKEGCGQVVGPQPSIQDRTLNFTQILGGGSLGNKELRITIQGDGLLWTGLNSASGTSPLGVYTRSGGTSATPATLEVILA